MTPFLRNKLETELTDYAVPHPRETSGPYADNLRADVIIVGAGFAGIFMLKTLRDLGFHAVVFEAGNDLGGTWRWNCYPGANTDSEVPEYEYSWPEVYSTWTWSTNYPDYRELRTYFDHVDRVLGIRKDCAFNTVVVGAGFDVAAGSWRIDTADGRTSRSKFLVVCTGFSSKRYVPAWPGLDKFRGEVHHSSFWPDREVDVRSKRCGVIGTGASGVQIVQAWGPVAERLVVFQRTPNLALPMGKRKLGQAEQERGKKWYPELFRLREQCFAGFLYTFAEKNTFDDAAADREAFYQRLWDGGGFRFWLANYKDLLVDAKANREAYRFWVGKVRARVHDARKRDVLAPLDMPHFFGVKRPCLEDTYYEQFNRPSVDVVDVGRNPIAAFTETGVALADGSHHDLDVVALATGFDVATGSMTAMGLRSLRGSALADDWRSAADTYLGLTVPGYPNLFHVYGVHGPTLLSNGPTTIEIQGRWIADCIVKMARTHVKYIHPTPEAVRNWKARINLLSDRTLLPTTRSTYMGGSLPGKAFEQINFAGGVATYAHEIREALDGWLGFDVVMEDGHGGEDGVRL